MQNFKNIIFDLGVVFLNIDFLRTEQAFADLGIKSFPALYSQHHASDLFELLETGKIEPPIFYDRFREQAQTKSSDTQIRNAWNAMLLDFPVERLQWLDGIRKKYRIFLFSNTNAIHYEAFMEIFGKINSQQNFNDYFIAAYYSHQVGIRKPYPSAFTEILKLQELKASETLFIDDTYKNIEGAEKAGLLTLHLKSPETVLDLNL